MKTISPQQLHEKMQSGEQIHLVDVRTPVEYRATHVESARNVPLDRLDPEAVIREANGSEQPLYFICQSGSRAEKACEKLKQAGFHNVINVEGGTNACAQADLPLVHGKKAISLERQVRIAAGSLVLILVWVYYSAMILLLGAEFTQKWSRWRGHRIHPEGGAARVIEQEVTVDRTPVSD